MTRNRWLAAAALIGLAVFGLWAKPFALLPERQDPSVVSIELDPVYRQQYLLAQAWRFPVAVAYRRAGFTHQDNASFCGPASASNLLRSAGIEASQDALAALSSAQSILGSLPMGLTLDEEADMLRKAAPWPVTVVRDSTLADFRAHLSGANDPARRYIVNFDRGALFGRGHGHFSPVLGYLSGPDLVFVGDVNRDYGAYLVRTERLWRATDTVDSTSGKSRGLIVVDIRPEPDGTAPGSRTPSPP
ncbi:phytochelatin synthase family protein [Emcibacter sp. SYSU 3D8]|uniref:phytochelatin synthase family protein n=1 Tax=Emcibacter sp. SYSU 3D8 TaxID=3133969 RepID=UPI0031FEB484